MMHSRCDANKCMLCFLVEANLFLPSQHCSYHIQRSWTYCIFRTYVLAWKSQSPTYLEALTRVIHLSSMHSRIYMMEQYFFMRVMQARLAIAVQNLNLQFARICCVYSWVVLLPPNGHCYRQGRQCASVCLVLTRGMAIIHKICTFTARAVEKDSAKRSGWFCVGLE